MKRASFVARRQRLIEGLYPIREIRRDQVQGRCFICATPLARNTWRWIRFDDGSPDVRVCRNKLACAWRNDRGLCDRIV